MSKHAHLPARLALAASLALSPIVVAACGDDDAPGDEVAEDTALTEAPDEGDEDFFPEEEGPTYQGVYDQGFVGDIEVYLGDQVEVTAGVEEVAGPEAFTIAGIADSGVEPLLVLTATGAEFVEPGVEVRVTGTVRDSFAVTTAEEAFGLDLDDEALADYAGDYYLVAEEVEETGPAVVD